MAVEQYSNLAQDTLNGGIDAVTPTVVLNDASEFPSTGNFRILIDTEILICASRSSNTLTCTRGQEGTTAASHLNNATVTQVLTRDGLLTLGSAIHRKEAFASRPAAGTEGRLFLPSDGFVVQRENGTLWQSWGPSFPLVQPINSDFTWVNQGGASVTEDGGGIYLDAPIDASERYRVRVKTAPSPPYTLTAMILPNQLGVNYHMWGILWRNSGTGEIDSLNIAMVTTQPSCVELGRRLMNSATSFNSVPTFTDVGNPAPSFLRLVDDNVNRLFQYSRDGKNFQTLVSVARTNFITPDQIGWYVNVLNASFALGATLVHWKEE